MVREYLAYKVHNLISPRSYRARMARVTYVDSATGTPVETRNGIFMEHEDDVAKRMEGEVVEIRRALFDDVDPNQILETAIVAAFLGHVDWSLAALHNIRLVRQQNGNLQPVLYDLDFTGLVGTKYSIADPRLGIRSVKERLYRGPCKEPEELAQFFTPYREKKDAILKLYDDTPGLGRPLSQRREGVPEPVVQDAGHAARREVDVQGELQGRAGSVGGSRETGQRGCEATRTPFLLFASRYPSPVPASPRDRQSPPPNAP